MRFISLFLQSLIVPFLLFTITSCNKEAPREYELSEKDLVPEGIDYSHKTDAFYLTSVGKFKILKVDRLTGRESNFIEEKEYGYTPGVGLLVDDERDLLHAIGGYDRYNDSLSSLFTFNLLSGELIQKYDVLDSGAHLLNDLIIDTIGNLYLTNTKDSSVYILRQGQNRLERFFQSSEIDIPNGIAISDDNTKLYIASITKGIRILDLTSMQLLNKEDPTNISKGIDGLEFYQGNLYGIQNSARGNPFNFRKLKLNDSQDQIIDLHIIDGNTPELDVPLTFCIRDNEAVVIGNSNLGYLNQFTFEFPNHDSILNTKLLVYSLE